MPDDFNLDMNLDFDFDGQKKRPKQKKEEKQIAVSHRMSHRNYTRRATSERALELAMDWYFKEGDCYHCFSFGDVDFLSFVQHIARQQRIKYLAISTWVMAGEDVQELLSWHERGILGRADFYMGEIFTNQYPDAYKAAVKFLRHVGGRMVVFRNHAKVAMIIGERFDCLIESSANVNTNPRSENTVITVDRDLTREYIRLFNDIHSFDRDFDDVAVYEPED